MSWNSHVPALEHEDKQLKAVIFPVHLNFDCCSIQKPWPTRDPRSCNAGGHGPWELRGSLSFATVVSWRATYIEHCPEMGKIHFRLRLTDLQGRSPPWEANSFSAGQENPLILRILKVHYPKQYLRTPWSRELLEKLTGSQLVKKFTTFYGTRWFIPHSQVPTTTCPYPEPARSTPYPHTPLHEDPS